MKYPFIQSAVPEGEHFDESAIQGEGAWLSTAHFAALEAKGTELQTQLQSSADALATANSSVESANATIDELNATIEAQNKTAASDAATIENLNSRISTLEAENKKLGGQSSGQGTVLKVEKDENSQEAQAPGKKMSINSPEHPINQMAARRVAAAAAKK